MRGEDYVDSTAFRTSSSSLRHSLANVTCSTYIMLTLKRVPSTAHDNCYKASLITDNNYSQVVYRCVLGSTLESETEAALLIETPVTHSTLSTG